ncbi:MAG: hypothetical protein HQK94_17255 [Nitrospirae bacterium]|nr:hypothetical protein [Nitrospirota bacterium]
MPPSTIVEGGEHRVSCGVLAEAIDDRLDDNEFGKVMAALESIWRSCPEDLPADLSKEHDYYLIGTEG